VVTAAYRHVARQPHRRVRVVGFQTNVRTAWSDHDSDKEHVAFQDPSTVTESYADDLVRR
jgi:hypothetical protein